MNNFTREDMEEALLAIASMIDKTEKAKEKFARGTSHRTLQETRLKALNIASSLISRELADGGVSGYAGEELEKARAPIASLVSKCKKAQDKLAAGTWHHRMLGMNVKALEIALPLLTKALPNKPGR